MENNSLKFKIVLRNCIFDYNTAKTEIKSLFKTFHKAENVKYSITLDVHKIQQDKLYDGNMYEIRICISYNELQKVGHHFELFKSICKLWCNPDRNKLSNSWLAVSDKSVLPNDNKQFHSDISVKEIAFGTLPDMSNFVQHYHYKVLSDMKEIRCDFWHNQRYFVIYFKVNHHNCEMQKMHKFVVYYKSISNVIFNCVYNTELFELYISLSHTPFIYSDKQKLGEKNEVDDESRMLLAADQTYQQKTWERSLDFGCKCRNSACSLTKIGPCPVLKIVISGKCRIPKIIDRLMQRCPSPSTFYYCNIQTVIPKTNFKDFETFPFFYDDMVDDKLVKDSAFICQYAWEVALAKSFVIQDQFVLKHQLNSEMNYWESVKADLRHKSMMSPKAVAASLYQISELVSNNVIFVFEEAMKFFFEYFKQSINFIDLPEGMCLIRRIVITPSKVIPLPPSEHFDNRVIRQFQSDFMIRVSLQDDDFSKLTFAVNFHTKREQFLRKVERGYLCNGISIGPRYYEILASSNSQLREHGVWLYAEDHDGNTAASIRKWMGDFNHIHNVAKYMARMGQCFSSSEESVQVQLKCEDEVQIEDICNDKYTFSDGIGKISPDLAEEIRKLMEKRLPSKLLNNGNIYKPSAFQIRYKGYKGMVAEAPDLKGLKLGLRSSMNKFKCETSNVLEIVKVSAPRILFLNRPLITILEQLGVESNVFLELQKNMIIDLTDSLMYEDKAVSTLTNLSGLDFPFKKLLESGICLTQEPFFRSLLLSIYSIAIDQVRSKARVLIPHKYGRNMLGVLDESKTLEYGQVFVQYSEDVGNKESPLHILKGAVVVTKNPCMHPGDVRKLTAVDVPHLHHIKDCVVFPAKGPRPHPDEMAGSDLDGDEYVLIWLPQLIFEGNQKPMDYPSSGEKKHVGPIVVKDMVDFMFQYIQNDNIGTLANAHLALADHINDGIFSEACMKIAKKYPFVLDFAKTGVTEYLKTNEKPVHYPDFMEKGTSNNSYISRKALGLMYRVVRNLEASVSRIDAVSRAVSPDPHLVDPTWTQYQRQAETLARDYYKRVTGILQRYGIATETEVLTGSVGNVNEFCRNRQEKANAVSIVRSYLLSHMKRFRMTFFEAHAQHCKGRRLSKSMEKELKHRWASAWYMAVYSQHDGSVLSFAWVIADVLIELRKANLAASESFVAPKSSFLESADAVLLHEVCALSSNLDGQCPCEILLSQSVVQWMAQSSLFLSRASAPTVCYECSERTVGYFRQQSQAFCCSWRDDACACACDCSPMKRMMAFLKFYSTTVSEELGHCLLSCKGFRPANLQSIALETYVTAAVTQNRACLGHADAPPPGSDDPGPSDEGDPVRVSVHRDLEQLLIHHLGEFTELLQEQSGVRSIFLYPERDRRKNWCLLLHSSGKAWQRWNLQELLMDTDVISKFKARLGVGK